MLLFFSAIVTKLLFDKYSNFENIENCILFFNSFIFIFNTYTKLESLIYTTNVFSRKKVMKTLTSEISRICLLIYSFTLHSSTIQSVNTYISNLSFDENAIYITIDL